LQLEILFKDDGDPKITYHGLRHTHATILLNNGQSIKAIAQRFRLKVRVNIDKSILSSFI